MIINTFNGIIRIVVVIIRSKQTCRVDPQRDLVHVGEDVCFGTRVHDLEEPHCGEEFRFTGSRCGI